MDLKLSEIPGAFHLPRVRWPTVIQWVERNVPEADRPKAWSKIAREWLELLDAALGGNYRSIQTDSIILFAPDDFEEAVSLFDLAEAGLREMTDLLGDFGRQSRTGPLVILLFRDVNEYAEYVSPFDPELEVVRSAGVCFNRDYIHIALRPHQIDSVQRALLHEIAHACLGGRNLPLWFEEGITQLAEEAAVSPWARFHLDSDKATELRQYWREHGLDRFWWGDGFHTPDEGQLFSYQLAQVLFRQLLGDYRGKFPEFVRAASSDDAGEIAARETLGIGLADIAAEFLGPGQWEPAPPDGERFVARGGYFLAKGHLDLAISDLDSAIRLDDRSFEAFFHRGVANIRLHRIGDAIADLQRAIELNSKDFDAANHLAWILATCPDDTFRDGQRALKLATDVCERSGYSIWYCVGTLAAACAEIGDFEQAENFATESLFLAPEEEIAGCEERLQSYQAKMPWREVVE